MNRDIQIRVARESDAAALRDIYAPYVERTAVSFEYEAPDVAAFLERIRRVQERYPYLVAESDGALLGYAYAGSFHTREAYSWSAEASIYLRMDCRRMGVGSALYRALEAALRAMGVRRLYASIAVPDEPDVACEPAASDELARVGGQDASTRYSGLYVHDRTISHQR